MCKLNSTAITSTSWPLSVTHPSIHSSIESAPLPSSNSISYNSDKKYIEIVDTPQRHCQPCNRPFLLLMDTHHTIALVVSLTRPEWPPRTYTKLIKWILLLTILLKNFHKLLIELKYNDWCDDWTGRVLIAIEEPQPHSPPTPSSVDLSDTLPRAEWFKVSYENNI